MNAPILLNEQQIRHYLQQIGFNKAIDIHVFSELDSTNRWLKEASLSANLAICCAEKQTQGRGRFNRQWLSPYAENIYFSARWPWHNGLSQLSGLSLVISLALLACLRDQDINELIEIKWPNDLLWKSKKLAGILIEVNPQSIPQIIVGIGLNVNTDTQQQPLTDKPWCSLYEMTGQQFDRNRLIAGLVARCEEYFKQFAIHGFSLFQSAWQQVDFLKGQFVSVDLHGNLLQGIASGVNHLGELLVRDKLDQLHALSAGEASLTR